MIWDVKKLYILIEKNICKKAKESINSLVKRQEFANYHYVEYKKILDSKDNNYKKINLIFDDYSDNIKIQANVIACMQNMHSAFDILGHVIYYSLNLEANQETKIQEHKISIKTLGEKLRQVQSKNINQYNNLSLLLEKLIENSDFKHLDAIVNTSKHRYLINSDFTISDNFATYFFDSFKYKETDYQKCIVNDFIEREYNREKEFFIKIGNEIIEILQLHPSE